MVVIRADVFREDTPIDADVNTGRAFRDSILSIGGLGMRAGKK